MDPSRSYDDVTLDLSLDLSGEEARVLGCLIEKQATTPDSYPLTLNALRNACNQSTSRDPVVSYADHDVDTALTSLRERGLTRTVHSPSNRVTKYRHIAAEALQLDPAELALISVLMLRGPQTLGELKSRSERQHHFGSTDDVAAAVSGLASPPAAPGAPTRAAARPEGRPLGAPVGGGRRARRSAGRRRRIDWRSHRSRW